jgi:5-deoxy-D-glucuronate isomerase
VQLLASGVASLADDARLHRQILAPGKKVSPFALHSLAEDLPREAYHEEMYFFKVSPADGFGICHYYNDQGEEENFTVRDNTIMMAPLGYHTVVSAPGYTTYYLWFLAGEQRVQATVA